MSACQYLHIWNVGFENIACNPVISSYETERLNVRGAVTLSRTDLGNEDDLRSCHHIRALRVVGCQAFAMVWQWQIGSNDGKVQHSQTNDGW